MNNYNGRKKKKKKSYNIPEIKLTMFSAESVLTASSPSADTTEAKVDAYLKENNLENFTSVFLKW